tara:strand:- start:1848 stop:2987 length:1140 start_codon:yes stop_codon:yes gene_type:complete
MVKVFYWSPFISKIATPKAVVYSAISIKKYSRGKIEPSIINLFNEWDNYIEDIKENNLSIYNLFKIKKYIKLPEKGFLQSRFSFFFIFILSFFPLLNLLKKKKPDYLIIHLNTSLPLILLLLFKFETKFILRISGKPRLNFFRKILWKCVSNKLYKITTPTKIIAEDLVKQEIFSHNKVEILYDPVLYLKKIRINNRQKVNNSDKNKIVAIGRLTRQKNFKFLIECFSEIVKRYDNFTLHILGDGDEKISLQKLIKKNDLDKKVFLEGYKTEVSSYLINSYCFILSSLWEDPGFVIIESAINNTIILSSNCETGPKELLNNKVNSFIFENNNKISFINSFDEMIKTDEKTKFKIKLSMKKNINKFTLFQHYKKLSKLIL